MNQLPIFVNLKGRKVILIGEGEMADAKRRLYERAGAKLTDDMDADAMLAVVALEDDAQAHDVSQKLKSRGLLVNVVDRPELCDFTTPAIVDRSPVLIAIGTGGASAGLAKALRQRLEQILPETLGGLANALFAARENIKARWNNGADRRRAIDAALDPEGPLDPFKDSTDDAVENWLAATVTMRLPETIEIILHSNDADDLTLREARLLGQADRIYAASNVDNSVLTRARADAERLSIADYDADADLTGLTLMIRMAKWAP